MSSRGITLSRGRNPAWASIPVAFHSGRKYKERLNINMNTKWSLHFRTECCGAVYRERPGNRLTHSLRKKKVMNARHERQEKTHKYTCAYIVSVLCPVLQVSVFCSRNGLRVACRAGSTAVLQSISEWVSCSAGRCLLYTCCSTVIYSKYGRILQCDPAGL